MGLLTCCFSVSLPTKEATTACAEGAYLGLRTRTPKTVDPGHASLVIRNTGAQKPADTAEGGPQNKDVEILGAPVIRQWRDGLDCALALQALLCSAGRGETLPEARAAFVVQIIQRHLGASTVRLYAISASCSSAGLEDSLDDPLVQLAYASDPALLAGGCKDGRAAPQGHPERAAPDHCPMHEAVGTSSMLLRRALVDKMAVVHKCNPRRDSGTSAPDPCHSCHLTSVAAATVVESCGGTLDTTGKVAAAATATASYCSTCTASCTVPDGDAAAAEEGGCCRNLELCDADAVAGCAMIFAAVPLAFGTSPFAVLWIALPFEAPPPAPSEQQQRDCDARRRDTDAGTAATGGGTDTAAASATTSAANVDGDAVTPAAAAATAASDNGGGIAATRGGDASAVPGPVGLLCSPAALHHLALSASMALAAGLPNPQAHFRCLAMSMSRIINAASLVELVGGLCGALVRHVRHRFLVDPAAQAALVPSLDSRIAFMLRSEHVEGGGGGGTVSAAAVAAIATAAAMSAAGGLQSQPSASNSFSGWAAKLQQTQVQAQTLSRLRMSSVGPPGAPGGAMVSPLSTERSRSITVTANTGQPLVAGSSGTTSKRTRSSIAAELPRAYATVGGPEPGGGAAAAAAAAVAGAASVGGGLPGLRHSSLTALRPTVPRDVFMLEGSNPRSEASFALVSSGCAVAPPPTLSARAFRLSNTLLQAMIQAALSHHQQLQLQAPQQQTGATQWGVRRAASNTPRSAGPSSSTLAKAATSPAPAANPGAAGAAAAAGAATACQGPRCCVGDGGVLPGVCVCDCARHVQDEQQPNRDVCMLMMGSAAGGGEGRGQGAGGGAGSTAMSSWGVQGFGLSRGGGGGGGGGMAAEMDTTGGGGGAGGGSGAQSLVLLGLETGDGAVLAVYLGFPTPAPQKLLDGVRDSCQMLMSKALADLVRQRLRCLDLAAEWDTLRAGVPGSYLSISRASALVDSPAPLTAPPLSPVAALAGVPLRGGTACSSSDGTGLVVAGHGSMGTGKGLESPHAAGEVASTKANQLPFSGPLALPSPGGPGSMRRLSQAGPGGPVARPPLRRGGSITSQGFTSEAPGQAGVRAASSFRGLRGATTTAAAPGPSGTSSRRPSGRAMQVLARLAGRLSTSEKSAHDGGRDASMAAAAIGSGSRSPPDSGSFLARDGGDDDEVDDFLVDGATGGGVPAVPAAAAMLTVHDLDETYESWGMRAHLGALVDSIISTTLRGSGAHCRVDEGQGADSGASRLGAEGLEELQLSSVLGQGASGVVLRGTLGCAPVAVKIMEMPDADASALFGMVSDDPRLSGSNSTGGEDPEGAAAAAAGGGHAPGAGQGAAGGQRGCGGNGQQPGNLDGKAAADPREVRARRALLRNAMEVAIMRSISHVNIVQAYGVYDNVIMERHDGRQGVISLRRVNHQSHLNSDLKLSEPTQPGVPKTSPICTAIVMQLCDRGSLADVLHGRTFPALPLPPPHPSTSPAATAGAAMQYGRYWKGVFMTLLEIALALRHLHSRRLVHRDVKPGNILLKSSPGDPRGWTCKLADFGFVVVLDRMDTAQDDSLLPPANKSAVPFSHQSTGGAPTQHSAPASGHHHHGGSSGGGGSSGWYAVQQHLGGTVTHMAPEAFIKGARIDASVDVFSFGIIMWELVSSRGHRPYREFELDAISAAVTAGARPMFPPNDHVPLSYRQLARSCWSPHPRARPTAGELVTILKGMLENTSA